MNSIIIDRLPPEMLCEILKNLNLDELIKCKLVCKQWNSIISQLIELTKLVVVDGEIWRRRRWFDSNLLVKVDLEYCKSNSFLTHFNKNILSNLKQLSLYGLFPDSFDLNQLNLFTKLTQLEIHFRLLDKELNLNLSNLEVLYFAWLNIHSSLSIECPKLRVLFYDEIGDKNPLKIKYPESVKVLSSRFVGEKLAQFKNVEYLTCRFNFPEIFNENTLKRLRNLKEIKYDEKLGVIMYSFLDLTINEKISQLKFFMRNFLESANELKMPHLKVYLAGLPFNLDKMDLINFNFAVNQPARYLVEYDTLYAVNYEYLQDDFPFIEKVNYTQLVKSIGQIPKDYFTKFSSILIVSATGSIDQEHFLWFIKNLNYLKRLVLSDTNLTQSFFDELPTVCSLFELSLSENEEIELNFDFIDKFTGLGCLEIDKKLSLKSTLSLIKAFKSLKDSSTFKIQLKGKPYYIVKRDGEYDVSENSMVSKRNLNLDQVVEYIKELK